MCVIENCTRCASLETCMECDEKNDYYIVNETGLCEYCGIDQCLNCSNSKCINCNETNGYFVNNTSGKCDICSINNCIQC